VDTINWLSRDSDWKISSDTGLTKAEVELGRKWHVYETSRGVYPMTFEEYYALPSESVGEKNRYSWSWMCGCGRYHVVYDPIGEGDILHCPRSKRIYRCE
jgi:hypothetical protein